MISLLDVNRSTAGSPSYQTIEDLSAELAKQLEVAGVKVDGEEVEKLPHSTTNDIFKRQRDRPRQRLRWQLVVSLWVTLQRHAEMKGIDLGHMVPLEDLKRVFEAAEKGRPHVPGTLVPSPGGPAAVMLPRVPHELVRRQDAAGLLCGPSRHTPGQPRQSLGGTGLGGRRREPDGEVWPVLDGLSRDAAWRDYQDIVPWWLLGFLMAESSGVSMIRTYAPNTIPTLLQTSEYARQLILRDLPDVSAQELTRRVELRLCRQELLHQTAPPRVWMVLNELAVRDDMGSSTMMRAQIRHLIALAGRPNIVLQIMGADEGGQAFTGPLTVLRFTDPALSDIAFLENPGGAELALYPTQRREVDYFTAHFEKLTAAACSPRDSVLFLDALLRPPSVK
ncbi:DUF5753 domain-containing protein [Actinomadura harenae]|uniref:DUF5753 domain-containing protein n=1 Tax=Actinomadura harenae TaxID=2483351 RepID=A0A3M2LXF5_9ACTN|nr:DUF5753 domain-containing protein [Actinomadura harenae]RMI42069.1 hypothetical protein EBO15_20665 [Actinomadura harenae]